VFFLFTAFAGRKRPRHMDVFKAVPKLNRLKACGLERRKRGGRGASTTSFSGV
jgi:hypothetical protein